ncbi:hypothetical protein ACFYZB_20535 [Streptomyces sp. NPDC001852]|uniref:hypothetical protein n=1 Tax=Streptomyces sp. NPDC001852 TaxID=3364619 RepID=UPI00368B1ACB
MDELLGAADTYRLQVDDTEQVPGSLSFASDAGRRTPDAGRRSGRQTGLFGASPYFALNHAMASMAFIEPLLLPTMVALPAAAIASSDREWGNPALPLRRTPEPRTPPGGRIRRPDTVIATVCVLMAGPLAVFGRHPRGI